ncbi:MAG: CHC2 zinc finger domain-containing protein [Desulfamplus sp.]
MNDFIKIKQETSLKEIISLETGLQMGKHHLEHCPFCNGHDCFSINKDGQSYKCFQCPAQGDIFDFYQQFYGLNNYEALHKAAEHSGITLKTKQNNQTPALNTSDKINQAAVDYYHSHIKHNGALNYLIEKRGHKQLTLDYMQVGWSDGKLHSHLSKLGFKKEDILKSGLVKEKEGRLYDFFSSGLIVFPHIVNGKVMHYSIKDPKGKASYQLPSSNRDKKWRFYNQDAFNRYNELILVEGENDTLSVIDAGIKYVIGIIGQISEEQIKTLAAFKKKRFYLWMDNDFDDNNPFTKGFGYIRKICQTITDIDIKIILYSGCKDPDEYIQQYQGDCRSAILKLKDNAVNYLTWEILQAGTNETLERKLKHLKKFEIFSKISLFPEIERQIYIEKIEDLGFTYNAVKAQLDTDGGLKKRIALYMEGLQNKRDADPNTIADIIHNYFNDNGRFFRDKWDKVWLLYNYKIYDVGSNRPFNALLKRLTKLLPTKEPGRSTWESLASEAYNSSREIELGGWIFTERISKSIYLNLNSSNNTLIKIGVSKIEEIPNGINADHVLLKSSPKIAPFKYIPDADIHDSLSWFKKLIFDNLTCELEQRYFIICWLISSFLADFSPHVSPLLKAEGATASGKTTGARLLEYLLYGTDHLGEISVAGAYAEAAQSPLLIIDNLEYQDIKNEMLKFLLLCATRGSKTKRKSGTESEVTQEKPKALIMLTAIEPFTKSELINRTFTILFEKRFQSDSFIEDEVTGLIIEKRNLIISGLIKLVQEILRDLSSRTDYITILNKMFKGHSKERTNPYIALMMLILEKLLVHWEEQPNEEDIYTSWITYQNTLAREYEVTSNSILSMLNGLMREYRLAMSQEDMQNNYTFFDYELGQVSQYQHPEYGLTVLVSKAEPLKEEPSHTVRYVQMDFTSNDIVYAFARFCKNNGLKNPYPSGSVFGARLANDRKILQQGNWELITKDKDNPYIKTIRGNRYFRLRHTMIS